MSRLSGFVWGALLCLLPNVGWGQGLLVVTDPHQKVALPRPVIGKPAATGYRVKELAVQARVTDQVARVNVSQTFVNSGTTPLEVSFVFPLPYDGAIERLTLMVDNHEIPAKLLPAADARQIFEAIVRKNRDPALLEWVGTGAFQTSVFPVPAGAARTVTLAYTQLLRKSQGLTDFLFPLSTARYTSQPVEKVEFQVAIESSIDLKNIYSPTHAIELKRPDARHAVASYSSKGEVPASDFRLFLDVDKGKLGATVVSYRPSNKEDGFFLMLASPQVKADNMERVKKTVVFVMDRSGSMSDEKMDQAKAALKFVLENLREGDQFNIIAFDSIVESFRPQLQVYNDETRKAALGFIAGLSASGATNIDGALSVALTQLKDSRGPNYLIFMTDGQPTVGELNESKIVLAAKQRNNVNARMITFGVGYDVNSRLLDKLARGNNGQSEFVRPEENIEVIVSRLYARINSPLMTDVTANFEFDTVKVEDGPPVNRMFPRQFNDLFEGDQLVVVGRYRQSGRAKVTIAGHVGEKTESFQFPVDLVKESGDASFAFVEKLWAMRRIGEIIDELDLVGKNDELIQELVKLSTKHGILTPYTSFLANEADRPMDLAYDKSSVKTKSNLDRLEEADGAAAFSQRSEKKFFQESRQTSAPQSGAGAFGGAKVRDIDNDKDVFATGLRNSGNDALYCRGKTWMTPSLAKLDLVKDAAKIKTIERFTDEYFALVRANTREQNELLCSQRENEELLVELRGQAYLLK